MGIHPLLCQCPRAFRVGPQRSWNIFVGSSSNHKSMFQLCFTNAPSPRLVRWIKFSGHFSESKKMNVKFLPALGARTHQHIPWGCWSGRWAWSSSDGRTISRSCWKLIIFYLHFMNCIPEKNTMCATHFASRISDMFQTRYVHGIKITTLIIWLYNVKKIWINLVSSPVPNKFLVHFWIFYEYFMKKRCVLEKA